ncbi:hypothetical protein G6F35_012119 [Rhizopus arrhizus]|uniref:Uncharacterized protein n=1 Tax=Rhizopus delemar TaxID=936053 RepID=A0A9P6XPP3_9FUNG|nr:hypothetical protein G6F35_012119 [Rhizopus arrhizus]KAG1529762.1 hypothetical protein G6F50_017778 [Rhizopus delemar]
MRSMTGAGRPMHPAGGPQLRLRFLARARTVGADRPRPARHRQQRDRRHLPRQLAEERPAADRAGRGRRAGADAAPGR